MSDIWCDVTLGAIHLWRPHGGGGGQAQVDGGEGVQPHVDVHTKNLN